MCKLSKIKGEYIFYHFICVHLCLTSKLQLVPCSTGSLILWLPISLASFSNGCPIHWLLIRLVSFFIGFSITDFMFHWLPVSLASCSTDFMFHWLPVPVASCSSSFLFHWLPVPLVPCFTVLFSRIKNMCLLFSRHNTKSWKVSEELHLHWSEAIHLNWRSGALHLSHSSAHQQTIRWFQLRLCHLTS